MENSFRKVVYYLVAVLSIVAVVYAITHKEKLGYVNTGSNRSQSENSDSSNSPNQLSFKDGPVTLGSWTLNVEIADTPEKQEKGLSGRDSLDENAGMLFVFQDNAPGFWMKDMKFPLDFIWINAGGEIVEILPNIDPSTYPQVYEPLEPVKYVLEVNAGAAEANGLAVGDTLTQGE